MDYTEKVNALNNKKREINYAWLKKGVLILDPENTYIDEDVKIGEESVIYPNVFIQKGSVIGKNVTILTNSFLRLLSNRFFNILRGSFSSCTI